MQKKKILFIVPSLVIGGMEKMLVALANSQCRAGHKVTVITLNKNNDMGYMLDSGIRLIYKKPKTHRASKIPYIRHKLYDDGMWETRTTPEKLYRYYVGDKKFDVEIAFFRGLPIKIISGSTNKKAVKLAWVHNDFRKARGYKNNFRSMQQVFDAYASFDSVVCVSDQARKGFIKTIGDTGNTTTVYNMLPVEEIKEMAKEDAPLDIQRAKLHLVIVARLEDKAKGQLRLIETVSRLHNEGADISLAIIGGGADYDAIRKRILDNNASDFIDLLGEKRNPYPYIKNADLLICASYYEGYNLTVAEALILGVPVLSTKCTGPNEILDNGKYGMIVNNDESALYNGLKNVADDPQILDYYRAKALERQSFFDESKLLKQITALFERNDRT